jgi:4-amino-4-deoxy-L-arabinose transferase-like glycosyltransferase
LGNEARLVVILGLLCITLFLVGLGSRPLWNIDEGMHAATAKEMLLTGDWITPTFNGEKFYDKPALFNWLTALSLMLLGFTEFAARLPAAAMGIGSVALTYLLGRRLGGPILGFLGGTILATSPMFITLSRVVVHDIVLTFFVTLALLLFYAAYSQKTHRRKCVLSFYLALGLAVLTKGPVGIVLPGLTIGLFLVMKRELSFLKEMRIGWGLLIFFAVAAPWYVATSLKNPEYLRHFFIQQNVMNFISSAAARHPEPVYYYVPLLFGGFFPWSALLPVAIVVPFWNGFRNVDDGSLYLVLWFASVFLFFSAASSKLGPYILPLFPAVSLLVGRLWRDLCFAPTANWRRAFVYCTGFLSICLLGGLVYLFTHPPVKLERDYGVGLVWVDGLSVFISLLATGTFVLILMRRYRGAFAMNVATIVAGILSFVFIIAPSISPYRSSKRLALSLNRAFPAAEPLVFFRKVRDSALFYTNRKAIIFNKPAEMMDYLEANPGAEAFVSRYYFRIFPEISLSSEIVYEDGNDLIIRAKSSRPPIGATQPQ